ncbi:hypothetical protein P691DRAFT_803338 [Macrolepiota fuliginosa MF-IS2]|uniref:F-box domain-containing protein n=1 Tax=Macrolepiota fuliginosa MF-IS2 TaxID=1400762 RepID=A0A9P6C2U6_9AGAR|nr:hypothetical protein P691DRAFT_803338 [Macrolepiota fuliginosa MF-IS2]
MPLLWSHLTLTIKRYRTPGLDLLAHHLEHAKDVPFSLHLHFVPPCPTKIIFSHISAVLLRDQNARKLQTLRAECVPLDWVPLFSSLPSLKYLELSGVVKAPGSGGILSLVNFASLHRIDLSAPELTGIQLPWLQIMSVTLRCMTVDICISLLLQCPRLVEFHCYYTRRCGENGQNTVPEVDGLISLEYLEHFTWSYVPDATCAIHYPRLRFPSLRTFQWRSRSFRRPMVDSGEAFALQSLTTHLPPTLSSLHIHYAGSLPNNILDHILGHIASIRVLHLTKCKYTTVIDVISLINRIDLGKQGVCLPLLKKIVIQDPECPPNIQEREKLEAKLASYIIPMFSSRDPEKKKRFSFQIAMSGGLVSKRMRKVYLSLRRDRLAFNVWVDFAMTRSIEGVFEVERQAKERAVATAAQKPETSPNQPEKTIVMTFKGITDAH